ncbi:MAG TPA: alpha-hydroxy-acid oxidizing protein [Trueperaceae bacterium]|nr:alpha-hydroxy-acid oxidizing protein [Trueperaceae bacterium]
MSRSEDAALDGYQLIPRLLHEVREVDTGTTLLGRTLSSPMLPRRGPDAAPEAGVPAVVDADAVLADPGHHPPADAVALLRPAKMGELMPAVRALSELGVAAIGLDMAPLADTAPFGRGAWRPRTREDLAELRAAANCPLWVFGVASAADAEVAAEAGLEAVVVQSSAGARLGGPAVVDVLPEVIDAVAGMLLILSGGAVRDGVDVLRYLAVGAEALVVESDRALASLEAELHYAMRMTGCSCLADVGYDIIFAPLFGES